MRRRARLQAALAASALLAGVGCGANPGESVGQTSSAITFPNDQPAFEFFVGKGLTPAQAAGIVGNLDQESGVDPTAVESGGPGRGIAQWSVGGRWDTDDADNATAYATAQGQSLLSLQLQLDFIWYELTSFPEYGLADLQATTDVSDATIVFETDFEGCGDCDQAQRIAYAENVLAVFGPASTDAGAASDVAGSDASSSACTVSTSGEWGVCLDTTACAAMAGHVATPGYCPGPANIQCCTATDAGAVSADDAAAPTSGPDASLGKGRPSVDAAVDGDPTHVPDGGLDTPLPGTPAGGCATSPAFGEGSTGGWVFGGALIALLRRRRRREGHGPTCTA